MMSGGLLNTEVDDVVVGMEFSLSGDELRSKRERRKAASDDSAGPPPMTVIFLTELPFLAETSILSPFSLIFTSMRSSPCGKRQINNTSQS